MTERTGIEKRVELASATAEQRETFLELVRGFIVEHDCNATDVEAAAVMWDQQHRYASLPSAGSIEAWLRTARADRKANDVHYTASPSSVRQEILVRLERMRGTWSETEATDGNIVAHFHQFKSTCGWSAVALANGQVVR